MDITHLSMLKLTGPTVIVQMALYKRAIAITYLVYTLNKGVINHV